MADPNQAAPDATTVALLSELIHCLLRVVIISGRDTDVLVRRVPLPQALFIGNHGLEEWDGGGSRIVVEAQPYLGQLQRAGDAVERLALGWPPGISIERKRATISVHVRNAADPSASSSVVRPALEEIAHSQQLRLQSGRLVFELRPPVDLDKGEVLRRLAAAIKPAGLVYIGDDRTDADGFAALKRMSWLRNIGVGVRSPEVPDDVFVDADLMVDGVPGVIDLLRQLLDLCASA